MDENKIKIIKIDNDYYFGEGYIEKNSNNFIKNGKGLYLKDHNKTENSTFYFGEWINNKRSGKCYIKNENKDVLIGDFDINGNGKGIYFWFNQKYFFGEFVKEKLSKGFLFSQNIESNDYKLNGNLYYGNFNGSCCGWKSLRRCLWGGQILDQECEYQICNIQEPYQGKG